MINSTPPSPQKPANEADDEEILSPAELVEVWARRAHELAKEPSAPDTGQTMNLLVFWLDNEQYGIEVSNVREIFPLGHLTPVPRTPNFVAGVFSARGRILSVIDLRTFLGLSASPVNREGMGSDSQSKIIVVTNTDPTSKTAQMEVGILVDEVSDVVTIFKDDIELPLTTHTGTQAKYQYGITTDLMVILNLNILLNDKQLIVQEEIL